MTFLLVLLKERNVPSVDRRRQVTKHFLHDTTGFVLLDFTILSWRSSQQFLINTYQDSPFHCPKLFFLNKSCEIQYFYIHYIYYYLPALQWQKLLLFLETHINWLNPALQFTLCGKRSGKQYFSLSLPTEPDVSFHLSIYWFAHLG